MGYNILMQVGIRTFRTTKAKGMSTFVKELKHAMNEDVKDHYIKEFDKIVAPWGSNISFKSLMKVTVDSISIFIFPVGKDKMKFIWVDKGTKKHDITGSPLFIPIARYVPYTQPIAKTGGYGGRPSGRFGEGVSKVTTVTHPGIKPRLFSENIAKDANNKRIFNNAIRRAIRRTING